MPKDNSPAEMLAELDQVIREHKDNPPDRKGWSVEARLTVLEKQVHLTMAMVLDSMRFHLTADARTEQRDRVERLEREKAQVEALLAIVAQAKSIGSA